MQASTVLNTTHYLDTLKAQSEPIERFNQMTDSEKFEYILGIDLTTEQTYEQQVINHRKYSETNQLKDDTVLTLTFE